jgi:hypothetical protein
MAIALFYAVGTALGGITGPNIFGQLIGTGDRTDLLFGYGIAAALMILAGARGLGAMAAVVSVVALMFGVGASQGLIPGVENTDRDLPATEPGAQRQSGEEPGPDDTGDG